MSFRLFQAPFEGSGDFDGEGTCSLCSERAEALFTLGIGADVIVACASCATENALDAADRANGACVQCERDIPFPALDVVIRVCEVCMHHGRVAFTKDTELGMVRFSDAREGWTHGLPDFQSTEWETSPPNEDGWIRVRVPSQLLLELVRTPTYSTIQGDRWLFCCREPMVFVGTWTRERFCAETPDGDGEKLFATIVEDVVDGLWEDELHDETGVYVFVCSKCGRHRAHWDIA